LMVMVATLSATSYWMNSDMVGDLTG